ncbi:tRNA (adenosine(37)-N6)-dimethylallyltransferase MiaA [Helicobacter sp. T3_23-1059]
MQLAHKLEKNDIFAIVAPTASGKSTLAINLAEKLNANIFSFDSLSIYKYISIASAKPSPSNLAKIKHYGVNELEPDKHCNAGVFMDIFTRALQESRNAKKILICVGGSGFYLHSIMQGLSKNPIKSSADFSPKSNLTKSSLDFNADFSLQNSQFNAKISSLKNPYKFLESIDSISAKNIHPNDTYRIQKLLSIYYASGIVPSEYFKTHKKTPLFSNIPIYIIDTPKEMLNERIQTRTNAMLKQGLVDEAKWLLQKYGREIQPFKAIGLKECLIDFQNNVDLSKPKNIENLCEQIATHTRQLAKRQRTFNRSKFSNATCLPYNELEAKILKDFG